MALSRDKIVDAALRLMDREGLQGVSMRKLAQELDAGAATLYWHVGDKEQLLGLMLDRIVGESQVVEPDPEHGRSRSSSSPATRASCSRRTGTPRSSRWGASRPGRTLSLYWSVTSLCWPRLRFRRA